MPGPIKGLKPCPFCGGEKLTICETEFLPESRPAYAVGCLTHGCAAVIFSLGFGQFETEAEAVAAWNTRK